MVSITDVHESNSRISSIYGPNLVAVFVGGTNGIGEATARAFVKHSTSPRVYLVGRDGARASRIIEELKKVNEGAQVDFLQSDVSLLKGVDEVCKTVQEKEKEINLLFLTPGVGTMSNSRTETEEGLDRKFSLHYYARMRFVANLLSQLEAAGADNKLARVVSVLDASREGPLNLNDLDLKTTYSIRNCARHAITMNSVAMEVLSQAHQGVSFVHTFPGLVDTGILRESGWYMKAAVGIVKVLAKPWETPIEESGERHLYAATSKTFPPKQGGGEVEGAVEGSDGVKGSGFYRMGTDCAVYKPVSIMEQYRKDGASKDIWQHTLDMFQSICK